MSIEKFDHKDSYITSQVAHITCKKDLRKFCGRQFPMSYQWRIRHANHHCKYLYPPAYQLVVKCILLSKESYNVRLEKDGENCALSYTPFMEGHAGFSVTQVH